MTTPVSKISVVNFRIPSTQVSMSEMTLVIRAPVSACSISCFGVWTKCW